MAGQSDGWITTARVLRRAGFGATGAQVDAVSGQNWSKYVDAALAADPVADPGAVATPMPTPPALRGPGKGASVADRKEFNQQLAGQMTKPSDWWVRRMVAVRQPIHEKLTLLWHNHFATSAQKVRSASDMAGQNRKLRSLSLGDFRTLAYSMLTDAAMMHWLDAQTSTAKAPNENLAREFMELFTLGHGNGYTEDDVRQGARALTGWVIRPATGQTTMVPKRHDQAAKTIFGVTRNFDADGFCDAVLAQPKSPQHVAGRLWQQLASDTTPSSQALDRLVTAYAPARLKMVNSTLHALGQRPFYPPDVGGWPHGRVWMSTASADVRMRAASQLARAGDLSTVEDAAADDRIDAVGYLIGVGAWSDRTVKALEPLVSRPVQLVSAAVNTPEYLTS